MAADELLIALLHEEAPLRHLVQPGIGPAVIGGALLEIGFHGLRAYRRNPARAYSVAKKFS
jgi:hypothetical protein